MDTNYTVSANRTNITLRAFNRGVSGNLKSFNLLNLQGNWITFKRSPNTLSCQIIM